MHPDRKAEHTASFDELHPTYVGPGVPDGLAVVEHAQPPEPKPASKPLFKVKFTDKAKAAHNEKIITASKRLARRVRLAPGFFTGDRGEKIKRRIINKCQSLLT